MFPASKMQYSYKNVSQSTVARWLFTSSPKWLIILKVLTRSNQDSFCNVWQRCSEERAVLEEEVYVNARTRSFIGLLLLL